MRLFFLLSLAYLISGCADRGKEVEISDLRAGFANPPDTARPGVYWYFMDGNLSGEGMTADLESMKRAGIGHVVFLEVNVGVPRGPVDFFSREWQNLFRHAVREAERLGIEITLGVGPGWTGSGGPWVSPDQSMQHLVSSSVDVSGPGNKTISLTAPEPRKPYFGEGVLTPDLKKQRQDFYEDVAVLAFPAPEGGRKIEDIDEKALYYRAPYTSAPGVKPFLPAPAEYDSLPESAVIAREEVIELTDKLRPDGSLNWDVPPGKWTVMRFGRRNNGMITRPAPHPGLGFESDKFDTVALNAHLDAYIGALLRHTGPPDTTSPGGLKRLHMDSWEMGAQNWTPQFREAFMKRRGYDPRPFFPVYTGYVVESAEVSERFLWDLRQTSQELILEYHAGHLRKYSRRHGLKLSIEPYDMNPTADLELGAVADVLMGEFWSKGFGFNSAFSCIEATSVTHLKGQPLVPAEAFTAHGEDWKQYPGSMKNQGDWAFAAGINQLVYHTFQHQPLKEDLLPGMTMGPYGVHWDRGQTWWPMAGGYHRYISRCQYMLQQGRTVADILYLTPEGAPHVFRPPSSALTGNDTIPDRKGYNFDGCPPGLLHSATVKDHRILFPGGASYRMLVLPYTETMTPALLEKLRSLVERGAVVVGSPPLKSPSLSGFPACDQEVRSKAAALWGGMQIPGVRTVRNYGKGKVIWGGPFRKTGNDLYPGYDLTAGLLQKMGVPEDFTSPGPVRYTHRTNTDWDIYFVANRTDRPLKTRCAFRTDKGNPELWDPLTGNTRSLPEFRINGGRTMIPLQFEPYQSFFIVFARGASGGPPPADAAKNFPDKSAITRIDGPWTVSFDPEWGGPGKVVFDRLTDWSTHPDEGIRYYSGTALYRKSFDLPNGDVSGKNTRIYLDLGTVNHMARVLLNGEDLGVVWTAPWKVDITEALQPRENQLEIRVVNLWVNRLIGDEQLPDDGIKNGRWPEWIVKGKERSSGRYTFTTFHPYEKDSPLLKSGLIGPVTIHREDF